MARGKCPQCGKFCKSIKAHINASHSNPPNPPAGSLSETTGGQEDTLNKEAAVREAESMVSENEVPENNDMAKAIEPLVVKAVSRILSDIDLSAAIDKSVGGRIAKVEAALSAKIDTIATGIQQSAQANQLAQGPAAPAPVNSGQQQPPAGGGNSMMEQVLAIAVQKMLGGGGSDSAGDFTKFLTQMTSFQEASAALYQGPRQQAQKEIIDIMKAGYSIGLETKQVIGGAEKALVQSTETKPEPKPS